MTTAERSLSERLAAALQIRSGEGARTGLLFTHLLLASAIFILGRTVRDTLFLSRYPLTALPWMFVLYGVASAITVVLYALVADRMARHRLIMLSVAIGAATYLATWVLVRMGFTFVYPVFYVWSEVAANLFIVQFWTLANDLHNPRAARRLVPVIGAARILGVVVIGLATGFVVRLIGTEQLLFVLIGMMGFIALIARRLGREPRADSASAKHRKRGKPPSILRDPYVRVLSLFLLLAFTALTIGDYQFKVIARATYREDALAAFFSLFYAGTGILSLLFQIFVTPWVLRRFGVGAGLSVMPTVFGAASLALPFVPHLAVATAMKFADNGFQYTIHETTLQALYAPFAPAVKARTRAFLDAVVKPLSYGAGGIVLVALATHVEAAHLSILTVGMVIAWLVLVRRVRRRYLATLEATLSVRGALALEPGFVVDSEGRAGLLRTLCEGEPRVAIVALGELSGKELRPEEVAPAREAIERLVSITSGAERALALSRLATLASAHAAPARDALDAPEPEVRAAAILAVAQIEGDEAVETLALHLEADASDERTAALYGLLHFGGVDGVLRGGTTLERWLTSSDRRDRADAANVLGRLGVAACAPVRRLLDDPDPSVRRAALRAAAHVADPRLIPQLIQRLALPSMSKRAGAALIAVGPHAVEPLLDALVAPETPRRVRLEVPRILRGIPTTKAYERLRALASVTDDHLRLRILASLGRLRAALDRPAEPLSFVVECVREELRDGFTRLRSYERAKLTYTSETLADEMELRERRVTRRVLRLLELRYPRGPLGLARRSLEDTARRGNAVELLDTMLEPDLRALIVPWFDDVSVEERVANAKLAAEPIDPETFLIEDTESDNPFVVAVSLDALTEHPSVRVAARARELLHHRASWVREAAVAALFTVDRAGAAEQIAPLAEDTDPMVAGRVQQVLSVLARGGDDEEIAMRTTLEKILILKRAAVFGGVPAEDLAPLAHVAEEVTYEPGETLCTEGEVGDELFVIVSGRVRVHTGSETLALFGPDDAVGELSVLDAEPRSATVTATEQTEVLAIGSEEFYEILHEQSEIAEGVLKLLAKRLRDANIDPKGRKSIV